MFNLDFEIQFILLTKLLESNYRLSYGEKLSEFSIEYYWYDSEDNLQMDERVSGKNLKELFSNYVEFKRKKQK